MPLAHLIQASRQPVAKSLHAGKGQLDFALDLRANGRQACPPSRDNFDDHGLWQGNRPADLACEPDSDVSQSALSFRSCAFYFDVDGDHLEHSFRATIGSGLGNCDGISGNAAVSAVAKTEYRQPFVKRGGGKVEPHMVLDRLAADA